MVQFIIIFLLVFSTFQGFAMAQSSTPEPILPETLRWAKPPDMPGIQGAWVLGADQRPGSYILRVRLSAGARIASHTHPDERHTTVLSGTIYVGFGETFNESSVVSVPTGAVYVAPANVAHYVWAKEGDAEYQEAGFGPTSTEFTKT